MGRHCISSHIPQRNAFALFINATTKMWHNPDDPDVGATDLKMIVNLFDHTLFLFHRLETNFICYINDIRYSFLHLAQVECILPWLPPFQFII
jgi:hypothetical protein